ncbi:MAG: ABC transporter permease, partial [Methanobrevibacter sp.]|nr:ABC transporter permease [Methanobrevibacter sp.]
MRYITLILKNPFRNKTRTALSVIGIAIGIATIVALGLITDGLDESIQTTLNSGGAEITVTGAIDNEANTKDINTSYLDTLANISGVNETAGLLRIQEINLDEMMNGERTSITAYGIDRDKLDLVGIENVNGSLFEENSSDAIMGKSFAQTQNKSIGDTVSIEGHEFKIVGEFETGSLLSDNSLYVSKEKLQEITGKDHLTQILIKTNENVNDTKIADEIEDKYKDDLLTFTTEEQVQMMSRITSILDLVTYAISALAIVIGGIGIINTMIMAVYERTKEIGVLRAVGWKSRRILMMIIGETLVLT